MSDLDPQQVASRATGHFHPCFPANSPVIRSVFASKLEVFRIPECTVRCAASGEAVPESEYSRIAYVAWKREGETLNLLVTKRSSDICEGVRLIKDQRVAKCAATKRSTERQSLMSLTGSYLAFGFHPLGAHDTSGGSSDCLAV